MDHGSCDQLIQRRILIVDDHPKTTKMLARVLSGFDQPVTIQTATSGEEALSIIGDEPLDILITDFFMPGMSGIDLVAKLKDGREPRRTILITGYDTPGLNEQASELNISRLLIKPVEPEMLRKIVSAYLNEPGNHSGGGS